MYNGGLVREHHLSRCNSNIMLDRRLFRIQHLIICNQGWPRPTSASIFNFRFLSFMGYLQKVKQQLSHSFIIRHIVSDILICYEFDQIKYPIILEIDDLPQTATHSVSLVLMLVISARLHISYALPGIEP